MLLLRASINSFTPTNFPVQLEKHNGKRSKKSNIGDIKKMPISVSAKKKSRLSKNVQSEEICSFYWFIAKTFFRIPTAIFFLILIFIWASSTTIISGNIVHVCVSSRKLNNLYCLSAGTQPNFDIPIPLLNGSSSSVSITSVNQKNDVTPHPNNVLENVSLPEIKISNVNEEKPDNQREIFSIKQSKYGIATSATDVAENVRPAFYNKHMDEESAMAYKNVEEQLGVHRSWISSIESNGKCEGRGMYVYELPSKFNKDLMGDCKDMIPWMNLCDYFSNDALGQPISKLGKGWHHTHQYSLEPIFHSRVLKHPCRVYNQEDAKLFYVPFYGGLDILRWHFKNVSNEVKDSLSLELVRWLETQKPWYKKSGKDHVFVLGKISWDFRRIGNSTWGSRLLELDEMQNPIKLLIERQPWHVNDIGIPHPTYFHPQTDEDIITWQLKIIRSKRDSFVGFAGAARPEAKDSIRSRLIEQCITNGGKCRFLNCSSRACDYQPEKLIELFVESEFCLQPPGDSPTRKSVFDSLISGCIPVIFDPFTAYYQYPWHLPEDHERYSVFIEKEEVGSNNVDIVERLEKIPLKERENMRRYIVYELLPRIVYGNQDSQLQDFQDAFSITMNNLIERVKRL